MSLLNINFSADDIATKDILELMGAEQMPEDQKKRVYDGMMETIELRVISRVDELLDDNEAEQLKKIIDDGSQEEFNQLTKDKNIDLDKLFIEETIAYKMELIALMDNNGGQDGQR